MLILAFATGRTLSRLTGAGAFTSAISHTISTVRHDSRSGRGLGCDAPAAGGSPAASPAAWASGCDAAKPPSSRVRCFRPGAAFREPRRHLSVAMPALRNATTQRRQCLLRVIATCVVPTSKAQQVFAGATQVATGLAAKPRLSIGKPWRSRTGKHLHRKPAPAMNRPHDGFALCIMFSVAIDAKYLIRMTSRCGTDAAWIPMCVIRASPTRTHP